MVLAPSMRYLPLKKAMQNGKPVFGYNGLVFSIFFLIFAEL